MKNITVDILAIIASTIIFTFNTASAADRVRVFEMGESGHTIEFPMTPAELAAENSGNALLTATGRANVTKSKEKVKVFEMGEGSHMVAFPMPAAEVTAEIAANVRLAAIRAAKAAKPKKRSDVFELAESGLTFEFPVTVTDTEVRDSAIAGSNFENEDLSI